MDNEGACEVGHWQVGCSGSLEGGWQGLGGARLGYGYPAPLCKQLQILYPHDMSF